MDSFVSSLITSLENHSNPNEAQRMHLYMKEHFPYYGIKAPIRKRILKEISDQYKKELSHNRVILIANELYQKPERELHYCAMELVDRFLKRKYTLEDLDFITHLISQNSWWDTVDFIAKHILGNYLLQFPNQIPTIINSYSTSKNMWLNRSAILFQLGYKGNTYSKLLFELCEQHKKSKEFFIKKAIGWALREYSKVEPQIVKNYITSTNLQALSEKEGLKIINR